MQNFLPIRKQLIANSIRDWGDEYWIENKKIIDIISNVCELVKVPDSVTILPMQYPSMLVLWNKKEIISLNGTYNGMEYNAEFPSGYESAPVIADCQMLKRLTSTNTMFSHFNEDIMGLAKDISNLLEAYSRHYVGKRIAYCPFSINLKYNPAWHYGERIIPFWRSAKKILPS